MDRTPLSGTSSSSQETDSRPTSSLSVEPEKEPLTFDFNSFNKTKEGVKLLEHIKSLAEQLLYHWKTFPIILPEPLSKSINLGDLFIEPQFDELDAVALNDTGEPKRLTQLQLKSLRDCGEFDVPSLNFPGKVHRWRVSQWLQKGYLCSKETLLNDLARAARFIVITGKYRISGNFFSVFESARSLFKGFLKLIDMIIGIPLLLTSNFDYQIKEERCQYLVAELICRPEYEHYIPSFCAYVQEQLRTATNKEFDIEDDAKPIPYLYKTPQGLDIDLRLFSRDIIQKALPILENTLKQETHGWFLHFRERLVTELLDKKMTDIEIEEEVYEAMMQEYLQRVYNSILNDTGLAQLGDKIPQLLVEQAQSVLHMVKGVEKLEREIERSQTEHRQFLMNKNQVLSKIELWLQLKLQAAEADALSKRIWSPHEQALEMCHEHNLHQTAYFLSRDLAFMKEREPALLKELKKIKTPSRTFTFQCRIWCPSSWIIRRTFQGQSEIVPTIICQQATSIVEPRFDLNEPVFLVEKEIVRTTSTKWPFWRLLNLVQRIWCWTWNSIFMFGFDIPWNGSLGLRALLCIKPFMTELELSQVNGTLFPRETSITQTFASRLMRLYRNVSQSRAHFETNPDTGLVGKSVARPIHQFWNFFVKGFLGTIGIVLTFPILCLTACVSSVFLAITAPIWIPFSAVCLHLFMMLVYDLDCPKGNRNSRFIIFEAVVWKILIQGCLQPVAALFVATILCPVASSVVFCFGITRYFLRLFWDFITFNFFIKNHARVPTSNNPTVHRIAGPGLIQDYSSSITPEQALAALEAQMQLDELQAYQQSMEELILQPQRDFSQFVESYFEPFSAQLSKTGQYYNLEFEGNELKLSLHKKLEQRRKDLQTNLNSSVRGRIKLSATDLKLAIQQGAHQLETFYPEHVIARLTDKNMFWDSKRLQIDDWVGLVGYLYTVIFNSDFLTPLSETEPPFKLEPHTQLDLSRYTEMVQNAIDTTNINGPYSHGDMYAARGNIRVNSPYLEVSVFDPRSEIRMESKRNIKPDPPTALTTSRLLELITQKMLIPLPIPHPVFIAIKIYNRDSDQPIHLDSRLKINK